MSRTKSPGVYLIENKVTGKRYVGSTTINLQQRWNDHKSGLRNNKHANIHLQRTWNKYGEESFVFSIIEQCTNVLEREKLGDDVFYIEDDKALAGLKKLLKLKDDES